MSKIGMICFAKPVLAEHLRIVKKEEFLVTCYMCDTYIWQNAKQSHKRQTHFLVREMLHKDCDRKNSAEKEKFSDCVSQGAELTGGKPQS
jgi:hypothetical protein